MERILRLDMAGMPKAWLTIEEAVLAYAKNLVGWELGNSLRLVIGGINGNGKRSILKIAPLIATEGQIMSQTKGQNSFSNRMLFKRDKHLCMYCGGGFAHSELTRDHILPRSRGGKDVWENVVAACKRCNQAKADRTPEEADMALLAIPFKPNVFEAMYLSQHTILADQMDYLETRFSGNRTW